jgi:hypothetical protein
MYLHFHYVPSHLDGDPFIITTIVAIIQSLSFNVNINGDYDCLKTGQLLE